jgi:hypothetical protein
MSHFVLVFILHFITHSSLAYHNVCSQCQPSPKLQVSRSDLLANEQHCSIFILEYQSRVIVIDLEPFAADLRRLRRRVIEWIIDLFGLIERLITKVKESKEALRREFLLLEALKGRYKILVERCEKRGLDIDQLSKTGNQAV